MLFYIVILTTELKYKLRVCDKDLFYILNVY